MSEVITWTVAGGSLVFLIGLISGIGSRRQRRHKPRIPNGAIPSRQVDIDTESASLSQDATSMAAHGVSNVSDRREDFATAGNTSR